VTVTKGVFQIALGTFIPLNSGLFPGAARYLGVSVNGEAELPRVELLSSPYAFRTNTSDTAGLALTISPTAGVTGLNSLTGPVTLTPGANVSIVPGGGNNLTISSTGTGGTDTHWTVVGNDMYANVTGNVGVGTSSPQADLHVSGGPGSATMLLEADTNNSGEGDQPLFKLLQDGALIQAALGFTQSSNDLKLYWTDLSDTTVLAFNNNISAGADLFVGGGITNFDGPSEVIDINSQAGRWRIGVLNNSTSSANDFFLSTLDTPDGKLFVTTTGEVGMGTTSPSGKLEVVGSIRSSGSNPRLFLTTETGTTTVNFDGNQSDGSGASLRMSSLTGGTKVDIDASENNDGSGSIKLFNAAGNVTIELDANDGSTGASKIVTDILEISGGADLSEQFAIRDESELAPGMLVSIDPELPGRLSISREAYDHRVAGVVSGAGGIRTGMMMGQRGTTAHGEHSVALSGRVYCQADATFGVITPGDLLTTSPTPGHAMRVTDPARAQGAIIGKAMTPLREGRGQVLILVSLQ
jgi:hypothetical protein